MWEASDDLSAMNNSVFSGTVGEQPTTPAAPAPDEKWLQELLGRHWLLRGTQRVPGVQRASASWMPGLCVHSLCLWDMSVLNRAPFSDDSFGKPSLTAPQLVTPLSRFHQGPTRQGVSPSPRGGLCPFLGSSPRVACELLQDRSVCPLLLSGAQHTKSAL